MVEKKRVLPSISSENAEGDDKIIIHYIWFEDYICFHNQGINLSTKYLFDYDSKDNAVNFKDNRDDYIIDFFDSNIDFTAIVGENGTGKTTLLRFLLNLREGSVIDTSCVIVSEYRTELYAFRFYGPDSEIGYKSIRINGWTPKIVELREFDKCRFPFCRDIRFIYLTEMFNKNHYVESLAGGDDLSFASILYDQTLYGDEEEHTSNPIIRYLHRTIDWQLLFFANGADYVKKFQIHYPSYFVIRLNYDKNAFENLYIQIKHRSGASEETLRAEAQEISRTLFKVHSGKSKIEKYKDNVAIAIFMNIFSSIRHVISMSKNEGGHIYDLMKQIDTSKNYAWENVRELLKKIQCVNDIFDSFIKQKKLEENVQVTDNISINANAYLSFMDFFSEFIQKYKAYNFFIIDEILIPTDDIKSIKEFFDNYKKCIKIVDFLSFDWNLSSGETLLLNQFGKLIHLLNKDQNENYFLPNNSSGYYKAKNVLLLLDEVEVAFHPEWQRNYLDAFLNFIKHNISDPGTHVQLVIATHSPIILSDIPKQNTVFLKMRNEKEAVVSLDNEETFAANIFSLFGNAFFLKESGIGSFAMRKLEWIIQQIQEKETDKNVILKYIKTVGDPFLRDKLFQEYYNTYESIDSLEVLKIRKNEIEKMIADLEGRMVDE